MAKSSKKSKEAAVPESGSAAPDRHSQRSRPGQANREQSLRREAGQGEEAAQSRRQARPRRRWKDGCGAANRGRETARRTRSAGDVAISDEDIRIRAYFISEQRRQSGSSGGFGARLAGGAPAIAERGWEKRLTSARRTLGNGSRGRTRFLHLFQEPVDRKWLRQKSANPRFLS